MPPRPADTPKTTPLRWVGFRQSAMQQGSRSQSQGFELAITPALFGIIGYVIDRVFHTVPVFTIALVVFAFVGVAVRMWYGYDAQMKTEQTRFLERKAEQRAEAEAVSEAARLDDESADLDDLPQLAPDDLELSTFAEESVGS